MICPECHKGTLKKRKDALVSPWDCDNCGFVWKEANPYFG